VAKASTGEVYDAFDARRGEEGYADRRVTLLAALADADLAGLPPNDLASSPLAGELLSAGAFRADVTGAGPVVYGLFEAGHDAERAASAVAGVAAHTWIATPG
jgi:hypothetical protein